MDYSYLPRLFILLILLLTSAFFSASETALMSISKLRVRHMTQEGISGSELIYKMIDKPGKMLSTILVANNAINIGASALATSLAIDYYGAGGVAIATGIMTLLVLIFAEITPKSLAAKKAEKISLYVIKPIAVFVTILNPIVIIFTYITNAILKLLGLKADGEKPFITEDELKTIVTVSHEEGVLEVEEKQMIYNVFEFGDLHISDVMVQRTDITAFHVDAPLTEILETLKEEQFSRYPVYDESIDDIVGILYVKDMLLVEGIQENFDIRKHMRKPFFTFEFKKISSLFKEMKKNRTHIAVVLDEYGGTAGIVTIEDLIEEIVGEIQDEYDEHEIEEIKVISENEFIVEGSAKITLVNEMLNTNIESENFDSIGGFIIGELGRLPKIGEVIEFNGSKFKVEILDKNRIKSIRVLK
ncbi:HlyC/CorC family transporter [Alkaliphilus transvaalensis]|uniref:HlyC/CorC family transporter n=1 Tax=Alkaliphilus transvaalensis TaxID=114628 RepID=UPI00047DD9ED|nr:hemolysin family protein [Alkaliphilus transvaalensis]